MHQIGLILCHQQKDYSTFFPPNSKFWQIWSLLSYCKNFITIYICFSQLFSCLYKEVETRVIQYISSLNKFVYKNMQEIYPNFNFNDNSSMGCNMTWQQRENWPYQYQSIKNIKVEYYFRARLFINLHIIVALDSLCLLSTNR